MYYTTHNIRFPFEATDSDLRSRIRPAAPLPVQADVQEVVLPRELPGHPAALAFRIERLKNISEEKIKSPQKQNRLSPYPRGRRVLKTNMSATKLHTSPKSTWRTTAEGLTPQTSANKKPRCKEMRCRTSTSRDNG